MNQTISRILQAQFMILQFDKNYLKRCETTSCSSSGIWNFPDPHQIFKESEEHREPRARAMLVHLLRQSPVWGRSSTVTRPAAVVSEAPVPHHTPLTMWPCHPKTSKGSHIAGVTEGHGLKGRTADPTGWQEHTTTEKTQKHQWVRRLSAETGPQLFPLTTQHISEAPLYPLHVCSAWKLIKLQDAKHHQKSTSAAKPPNYHKIKKALTWMAFCLAWWGWISKEDKEKQLVRKEKKSWTHGVLEGSSRR